MGLKNKRVLKNAYRLLSVTEYGVSQIEAKLAQAKMRGHRIKQRQLTTELERARIAQAQGQARYDMLTARMDGEF